jgi:uncharacterized protein (DUF58 family)
LVLAAAALLALSGALASVWALIALGMALAALLGASYLAFFPSAVLIWRRHVELVWALPGDRGERGNEGGLVAGRTFLLEVTLRNRGPVRLGRAQVRVVASTSIDPPRPAGSDEERPLEMEVGARSETTVIGEGRVRAAGFWYLHGAVVRVGDPLGIAALEAYFPSPLALKVLPRNVARVAPPPLRAAGASDERAGLHALRLRGLGGELRELRDHAPGDPFKQIAWKATARTGRLMVRDLDRETLVTHYLLVDAGATMRDGPVGKCGIDQAVELAAAYSRAALETGDRVGLVTFDGRLLAHLTPADGPVQRIRIIERLMESLHAVDEDATDLTDGELVAIVARYLRHQDSADVRLKVAPEIDDPSWSHIATGPRGELYDLKQLDRAVARTVDGGRGVRGARVSGSVEAGDLAMARLRLFCRLRGIELPHRRTPEAGRRARGLAAALEVAARGRGTERIVIFSDLEGLDGTLAPVARCVALARRRGHRLVCLAPTTGIVDDGRDAAVSEILGWERRRAARAARRRVEALGVSVLPLGPNDSLAEVVARLGGRRRIRA